MNGKKKKKTCEEVIFALIAVIIVVILLLSSAGIVVISTIAQRTPTLAAELSRTVVARGDDITVKGTVTGDIDEVDIVIIGRALTEKKTGVEHGFELTRSTVGGGGEFKIQIDIPESADTGVYVIMVLIPGRDGVYANTAAGEGELREALEVQGYDVPGFLVGKSQEQIVDIIKAVTIDVAGSDDLCSMFTFRVESAYVKLEDIEPVAVGEPLKIIGKTNREPGAGIVITTFAGPMDLPPAMVEVKWPTADEGVFTATIDTTDAAVGTYTFEADDGYGHTDMITVEIIEPVPKPTLVLTPTPTLIPTPTLTPEVKPRPTPSPTPTSIFTPEYTAHLKIKSAEEAIESASALGVNVDEAEEYLEKAKSSFDVGDFEQAKKYADKAEKIAIESKNKYLDASSEIKSAEEIIESARGRGVDIRGGELLLQEAKEALEDGDYSKAMELARQAKEKAEMSMMAHNVLTVTVIAVVIFIVVSVVRILGKK